SWAREKTLSSISISRAARSLPSLCIRRARGHVGTRCARVTESPLANRVTSCPIATSSSVRKETTRSVPPYSRGGTDSVRGAIWATRIFVTTFHQAPIGGQTTSHRPDQVFLRRRECGIAHHDE